MLIGRGMNHSRCAGHGPRSEHLLVSALWQARRNRRLGCLRHVVATVVLSVELTSLPPGNDRVCPPFSSDALNYRFEGL